LATLAAPAAATVLSDDLDAVIAAMLPGGEYRALGLYDAYKTHAAEQGHAIASQTVFGRALVGAGLTRRRTSSVTLWSKS
jgi:hypothetical protein